MNKLFCFVAILTTFSSCKKSSNSSNNNPPEQTLSYKRNGVYKEFNGIEKFHISNSTVNAFPPYKLMYNLYAHGSNDERIDLFLISSIFTQLTVGDYFCQPTIQNTSPTGGTTRYGVIYAFIRTYSSPNTFVEKEYDDKAGDFSQVKITKIENGYASGTFSGSATLINGTEKLSITEGNFTNFKMN
jgi:hypothetical protein